MTLFIIDTRLALCASAALPSPQGKGGVAPRTQSCCVCVCVCVRVRGAFPLFRLHRPPRRVREDGEKMGKGTGTLRGEGTSLTWQTEGPASSCFGDGKVDVCVFVRALFVHIVRL